FVVGTRQDQAYTQIVPQQQPRPQTAPNGQSTRKPESLIATTAPGTNAMVFPPGTAIRIPAGASLRFQIHYTTNGKEVSDRSSVGMIFAKERPEKEMHTSAFMNPQLILPAGAADVVVPTGTTRSCIRMAVRKRCCRYRITISIGRPTTSSRRLLPFLRDRSWRPLRTTTTLPITRRIPIPIRKFIGENRLGTRCSIPASITPSTMSRPSSGPITSESLRTTDPKIGGLQQPLQG